MILLGLIAAMGLGLALAGPAWQQQSAREREQQWLRVGELYARALGNYVAVSPGSVKLPPEQIDELLLDKRFVGVRRHLRQAYGDPLQPQQAWALLRDRQGRIAGVYSLAPGEPFVTVPPLGSSLQLRPDVQGYARWVFMARAPGTSSAIPSKS